MNFKAINDYIRQLLRLNKTVLEIQRLTGLTEADVKAHIRRIEEVK